MPKRKDHTVQVITITQPIPYVTKVTKNSFGKPLPEWHWLQPGQVLVVETSACGQRWHEYRSAQEAATHFDLDDDGDSLPSVLYDANGAVHIQPRLQRPNRYAASPWTDRVPAKPLGFEDVTLC